jgi:hypothetical protein
MVRMFVIALNGYYALTTILGHKEITFIWVQRALVEPTISETLFRLIPSDNFPYSVQIKLRDDRVTDPIVLAILVREV